MGGSRLDFERGELGSEGCQPTSECRIVLLATWAPFHWLKEKSGAHANGPMSISNPLSQVGFWPTKPTPQVQ